MALTTTSLGLQKPDGTEAVRDGDNIISGNAQKTDDLIVADRVRLTTIEAAGYVPAWKTATAYTAGQKVISPGGDVVSAIANHTSGASFTPANWTASTQDGRIGAIESKNAVQDNRLNGFLLAAGTDLNTLKTTNVYTAPADAVNWAALNYPQNAVISLRSFFWSATNGVHIADVYGTTSRHYFRICNSSGFQPWQCIDARIDAVEAVNAAQDARVDALVASELFHGAAPMANDEVAFGITDSAGMRSDLEVAKDGHFTQRVIDSVRTRLGLDAGPQIAEATADKIYINTSATGDRAYLGTITGASNPRMLDTQSVMVDTSTGPQWISASTGAGRPLLPTLDWACWGDSLTWSQATGQANPTWPQTLATDLGVSVYNGGRQGQASAEIATRQGGLRPLLTVTSDTIPASGTVTVTAISPVDGWRPSGTSVLAMEGTLAGIPGTLYHDASTQAWTFTRDAAGSSTSCPPNTAFIGTEGTAKRGNSVIIWAGTNNTTQPTAILRDIASMVAWLTPYTKRYLVLSLTTPGNDALNASLSATYGTHYEDIRSYIIANGLADAGITPTTDDTAAIAANNIPPSLLTDATHFTQAGYNVIGHRLSSRIRSRNWN
jgi:lysophospholipase L1-like esterase